jgi:hypothetical protein
MRKDDSLLDGASGAGREIDRRTIAKGVAWTVPVVIVATAAPAAAASGSVAVSSVAATFVPASNGAATVSLVVNVNATGPGHSITLTEIEQTVGGTTRTHNISGTVTARTFALSAGSNSLAATTVSNGARLAPVTSTLRFTVDGAAHPDFSFSIAPVTTFATNPVTVSNAGGDKRTFTFAFDQRNSQSKFEVLTIKTPLDNGDTIGWGNTGDSINLGDGPVTRTKDRPNVNSRRTADWTRTTLNVEIDNVPFSLVVDAS